MYKPHLCHLICHTALHARPFSLQAFVGTPSNSPKVPLAVTGGARGPGPANGRCHETMGFTAEIRHREEGLVKGPLADTEAELRCSFRYGRYRLLLFFLVYFCTNVCLIILVQAHLTFVDAHRHTPPPPTHTRRNAFAHILPLLIRMNMRESIRMCKS